MPTDVIMPQMGESIFEGTITKWFKKTGDAVEKDEPLFEISTDKVDAEIPSPVAGVLTEIRIAEGATVEVNTVVAVIGEATERSAPQIQSETVKNKTADVQQAVPKSQAAQAGGIAVVMPQMGESIFEGTVTKWLKKTGETVAKDEPLFEISTDKVDAEIPAPVSGVLTEIHVQEGETVGVNTVVAMIGSPVSESVAAPASPARKAETSAHVQTAVAAQTISTAAGGRIRSSPLARKIAKEHGVDLSRVAGSGAEGRVSKDDVLRAMKESGTGSGAAGANATQVAGSSQEPVPLTKMRAIIAERMVESKRVSPHVYTVYKVDMTRVAAHREAHKDAFDKTHGVKLTLMPYVASAAVTALKKMPIVNASLVSGSAGLGIRYHDNVHLGIAVALDWGLIVPVVRQAEQRSFADLARTITDLAGRARTKKLNPSEVGGSTFTLTNSGIFGDEFSMPIINQPEAAILCISGLKREPAVMTDAAGNDTIAIRAMQHLTLGFDHRLIDGADACKFMVEVKRVLESWDGELA
jgi:pyruvate dehydrogenase E2 component (dihydrolipoamide acetyltransferase)